MRLHVSLRCFFFPFHIKKHIIHTPLFIFISTSTHWGKLLKCLILNFIWSSITWVLNWAFFPSEDTMVLIFCAETASAFTHTLFRKYLVCMHLIIFNKDPNTLFSSDIKKTKKTSCLMCVFNITYANIFVFWIQDFILFQGFRDKPK